MITISDNFAHIDGAFSVGYYVPYSDGEDLFSYRLMGFKKYGYFFDKWQLIAYQELISNGIKYDFMVRVLKSTEVTNTPFSPLEGFCTFLSTHLGIKYVPYSIVKDRVTVPFKILNKQQRQAEISGVYKVSNYSSIVDGSKVLIVDDIVTTGTTVSEIACVIKSKYPNCIIHLFTLGRTIHDITANSSFDLNRFA